MTGVVYFVQGEASGAIKIGYSRKISSRMASMQTASSEPLKLLGHTPGDRSLERALHREFADSRQRGEWFRISPELIARIASLCTEADIVREISAPSDDPHTALARRWIGLIEDGATRGGRSTLTHARTAIARELGMALGFLENLRRGRIAAITARDFEAIRKSALESCENQMAAARADLSAVLTVLGRDRATR